MSESLLNEIRATKPVAPSALRDRVRALSAAEPAREPFLARFRMAAARARRAGRAGPGALRGDGDRPDARRRAPAATRSPPPAQARLRPRPRRFERAQPQQSAGAQGRWPLLPQRPTRAGRFRPPPASCSATRPSCACAWTTSTRSRARRRARSESRSRTAAASPRSSTRRRPRASAPRRSRSASRSPRCRAR